MNVACVASDLLKEQGVQTRVLDMHTIKPFDKQIVLEVARETGTIVTVEEHNINGGLGATVAFQLVQNSPVPMKILGMPDEPIVAGNSEEVFKHYNLTPKGLAEQMMILCNK